MKYCGYCKLHFGRELLFVLIFEMDYLGQINTSMITDSLNIYTVETLSVYIVQLTFRGCNDANV